MKKDSPLERDVFLEQNARLPLPISLPTGTSFRSSAPHTITSPVAQERRAGIVFPQCIISNIPQRPIGFELPVPDIARGVTLEPQGTIYSTQQGTSIVQPTVTSTSFPDDPVSPLLPELKQVLPPYSLQQEHNYGMPMHLVIASSGTTSTSTAETTTSSVQCPGAVLSVSETSTSCRPSIDVTSAIKLEMKDQDPVDMDCSLNIKLDTTRSVIVNSEEEECSDVEMSDTQKHIVHQASLINLIRQKMLSQSNTADFTRSSDKVSDYDKLLAAALNSRPVVLLNNLELDRAASHSEHKNVTKQITPTEQITPMCIKQEPDDMIPHIRGYNGQQDSIQTDMSLIDLKPTDVEITASTESFSGDILRYTSQSKEHLIHRQAYLVDATGTSASHHCEDLTTPDDNLKHKMSYKCDLCAFRTSWKSSLTQHIRTHTGKKRYKCEQCDYQTTQNSNLKLHHMRTHTRDKPHKCDQCAYETNQKSALKRHMKTHTGEKPYKCDHYDYWCADKNVLKLLHRTHTGEKP